MLNFNLRASPLPATDEVALDVQAAKGQSGRWRRLPRLALAGLVVAVGLGLWRQQPVLTLAGLLSLGVLGAEALWLRFGLAGVEYERHVSPSHAFWGEQAWLTLRIANKKLLPLTWLLVEDEAPDRVSMGQAPVVRGEFSLLAHLKVLLSLLPYQEVTRRYVLECRARGLFQFGPAQIEAGDLLGRAGQRVVDRKVARLLVYPKLFQLDMPSPRSPRMIGPRAADRIILTDPSRTVGVRKYQPGDPLRQVEWRASARSRDLLVRVFEPSTDPAAAIFLNSDLGGRERGAWDPPEIEFCISLAASLAKWLLDSGCPAGLFGNGEPSGPGAVRVPVSASPGQMHRILETLATASPFGPVSGLRRRWWDAYLGQTAATAATVRAGLGQLILREAPRLPFEASVLVVTAEADVDLLAACLEVQRRRPVTVFLLDSPGASHLNMPGLRVVHVPYQANWEELERLPLAA
ncbi:MAG TPA: DUF58 domain-containing protein [Chloroflexota bacterium]|nr:DUF58 domain-containing protein [Chloroflexota bacterium]